MILICRSERLQNLYKYFRIYLPNGFNPLKHFIQVFRWFYWNKIKHRLICITHITILINA